jgi:hypothetical protein
MAAHHLVLVPLEQTLRLAGRRAAGKWSVCLQAGAILLAAPHARPFPHLLRHLGKLSGTWSTPKEGEARRLLAA